MQIVPLRQPVWVLHVQVAALTAAKAEAEEEAKRYQKQVAQQRQGLSKNRVRSLRAAKFLVCRSPSTPQSAISTGCW